MSNQDQVTLATLLIPFFIFVTSLIAYFLYKTGKQNLPIENYVKDAGEVIIDLKPFLIKKLQTNMKQLRMMPPLILFLMYVFIMFIIILGQGPEAFNDILNPKSLLFKFAIGIFGLMSIGAYLAHLRLKLPLNTLEKAIRLAENKNLFFKINSSEITVPVLALTNPALWQATDKNLFEISISLNDIKSLEVFSKAGKAPSQYLIKLEGENRYLGDGALLGHHMGFGIKREYLREHENKIHSLFKDHLKERFILRDQNKK